MHCHMPNLSACEYNIHSIIIDNALLSRVSSSANQYTRIPCMTMQLCDS
jgi:hypothetical protein